MCKALLEGLYEMADSCQEALKDRQRSPSEEKAIRELEVMKLRAEAALQKNDFSNPVFQGINEAAMKAMVFREETA